MFRETNVVFGKTVPDVDPLGYQPDHPIYEVLQDVGVVIEWVRSEPPLAGDETAALVGSLERQRAIFAWKTGGLDAAGLRKTLPPSTMTLGGLIKHLALVEDDYFSEKLLGRDQGAPWNSVDWDADPDWEWHSAAEDTPEQLYSLWREA